MIHNDREAGARGDLDGKSPEHNQCAAISAHGASGEIFFQQRGQPYVDGVIRQIRCERDAPEVDGVTARDIAKPTVCGRGDVTFCGVSLGEI